MPHDAVKNNTAKINILDVGQGLAVVVQTKQHTLVYDTGPRFSDTLDAGSAAVVPYLRYAGVSNIDMLVVSHADNDHSGGLSSVLESIDVDEFITGSPEKINAQKECSNTQQWQWDGVLFEVLWPTKNEALSEKENNRSCVIKISVGPHSFLLTGDIEKPVEQSLVMASGEKLQADLLIAPHHGSKTSSTDAFIKAVQPIEVVFSSGYLSRFGHPHADVVARYERNGVNWRNTADSGGIIYQLSEQGIKYVEEYRRAHPHYWDAP
jgi:competence protein ComEC